MTQRSGSGGHKRKGEKVEEEHLSLDADVAIPVIPALAADVLAGSAEETGEELDEPPEPEDTAGEDEPDS